MSTSAVWSLTGHTRMPGVSSASSSHSYWKRCVWLHGTASASDAISATRASVMGVSIRSGVLRCLKRARWAFM